MNLTKLAVVTLVAGFSALASKADSYLYWMMDNYDTEYTFSSAALCAIDKNGAITTLSTIPSQEAFSHEGKTGQTVSSYLEMYTSIGSAYLNNGYSFMLELLNTDGDVSYVSQTVAYNAQNFVSSSGAMGATQVAFSMKVPEPTSGLLLLLGVAGLALRRRRLRGVVAALALCATFGAQAAYDDTMICFKTKGPDTYADGSQVLDGERYALCWSADGDFNGFQANGQPVDANDKVLMIVSAAKDGKCPLMAYAMPSTEYKAGGVISLWLLDTRTYAADGAVAFSKAEGTKQVASIAAAVKVSSDITVQPGVKNPSANEPASATVATAAPADAPKPVIKGIRIDNDAGLVYLTVDNTAAYLNYGVSAGATPSDLKSGAEKRPVTGGGEITIVTPKQEGAQFFSVGRK